MTPRTFKLYAFGETPSGKLDELPNIWGKNQQINQTPQLINFSKNPSDQKTLPGSFGKGNASYKSNLAGYLQKQNQNQN